MSRENSFDVRGKFRYARRLLRHRWEGQPRVCPYCGPSSVVTLVCRKKLIAEILECQTCHLWFRWPADNSTEHNDYYQEEFAGDSPQVILPDIVDLDCLIEKDFSGSPLDIRSKARVLHATHPGGRVLDFGCSWGYGTYQLRRQGFDAVGFEISRPRAEYGRVKMGLEIIDTIEQLEAMPSGSFDVVFSNHVIEHLPNIASVFSTLTRLLKENGFVFHILPNFLGKKARSGYWLKWIGEDHPIAPAIPFFQYAIPRAGLREPIFGSSPFDEKLIEALLHDSRAKISTEGDELLVLATKAT
jgi:2-polyprenyl-3-methyl-5-hydroxy-6-metoxy-1,4-benzoquinol methylase